DSKSSAATGRVFARRRIMPESAVAHLVEVQRSTEVAAVVENVLVVMRGLCGHVAIAASAAAWIRLRSRTGDRSLTGIPINFRPRRWQLEFAKLSFSDFRLSAVPNFLRASAQKVEQRPLGERLQSCRAAAKQ